MFYLARNFLSVTLASNLEVGDSYYLSLINVSEVLKHTLGLLCDVDGTKQYGFINYDLVALINCFG